MKNDKKISIFNFCDSCRHVMDERGEDLSIFSQEPLKKGKKINFCYSCGQPLTSDLNPFEKDLDLLESALENKNLMVVCFTAPSVRVALGDAFGMPAGEFVQGKMVSALKKLGFHAVFDMNSAADFTILEEANEFVERLERNENLPMFTSCCPGWVNFATSVYPELKKHLSTAKSPQQMFGALINNIYAQSQGINPPDIFVVSIVPCLAKKVELLEEGINTNIGFDVDVAITTKEIAEFIKYKGIDFANLDDSEFDDFFGSASGAGAIFGNTGGVMEAVLRTLGDRLSKTEQKTLDYKMVRGLDDIKRAEVKFGERTLHLAVVTGLKNLPTLLEELESDPHKYDFIEVMACAGGCVGGPGQPKVLMPRSELLKARAESLYAGEKQRMQRKAHKNPLVLKIYEDYLGEVGGEAAKKLLHRHYN